MFFLELVVFKIKFAALNNFVLHTFFFLLQTQLIYNLINLNKLKCFFFSFFFFFKLNL